MKILVADVPARGTAIDDEYPNLGLLYLAGYLKKAFGEKSIQVHYLGPKNSLKTHIEYVKLRRPRVYGISFTSKAASIAYETMRAVKEACPETWIICGGPHATALPQEVLSESVADVCVVGEGEITFAELVECIGEYGVPDLCDVKGIVFRQDGETEATPPRELIKDLNEIPFPDWDLINFRDYHGMFLKMQPIESSLLISRGCPFNCTFCSNPVWKISKPWLRHRSVDNICEEIELLYERGVREIYMSSDELNFSEKWPIDLCQAVLSLNHHDLYFQCNMRADKVSRRLAELLAETNCWLVHLGIESGNNRVLQGIGKGISTEQVENATQRLSDAGVKVFAFMMLYNVWEENGALCYETDEEVENSINFMKRLFKRKHIHYMSWEFCTPMPGSRLYEIAKRHNLFRRHPREVWDSIDEKVVALRLPGISEKRMRRKIKKGILLKDWFMLRSGRVNFHHMWRVWSNVKALLR